MPGHGAGRRNGFDALVHAKQAGECYVNHIVLCEHPHVYTLGRGGKEGAYAAGEGNSAAQGMGATLYRHSDRGGALRIMVGTSWSAIPYF